MMRLAERHEVIVIMGATVFFSMALIALTILSYNDVPRLTG